jgi:alpha-tubulin suppressor-like RCC1 family protein
MALTEKGNLFSWGNNCYGQLGVGDYSDRNTPTLISFDFGDSISSIATGCDHSMAFTKSGNIFVWGGNTQKDSWVSEIPTTETNPIFLIPLFPQTFSKHHSEIPKIFRISSFTSSLLLSLH